MHDAVGMCCRKPVGQLHGDRNGLFDRKGAPFKALLQRPPFAVGHGDEQLAVGRGLEAVDPADVRVGRCRPRLRFAHEPLHGHVVLAALRQQELERDLAIAAVVVGEIDAPLRADTEPGQHRVVGHDRSHQPVGGTAPGRDPHLEGAGRERPCRRRRAHLSIAHEGNLRRGNPGRR